MFPARESSSSFPKLPEGIWLPPSLLSTAYQRYSGEKQLECKAEHSRPYTAKLQMLGATSPLYHVVSRRGHSDKFAFFFGVLYKARKSCMVTTSVCLFIRYYRCVKRVSVFVNSGTGVLYKKMWNIFDFGESQLSDCYAVLKWKITFCSTFRVLNRLW